MKRICSILVIILVFLPNVLAITGEIGNAKAVLNREWNGKETLERTILVRNSNDVKLSIKLEPSDEIKDIVELIDGEFELQPGEEKKARYNLKIEEEGRWNGKINVYFRPEEGNSVVLSSVIILSVGNANNIDEIPEDFSEEEDEINGTTVDIEEEADDEENNDVSFGISGAKENKSNAVTIIVVIIALAVLGAAVGLYFLLKK